MADEQPRHSVEKLDPIPESRAASPTEPEPTHPPSRREGTLGLPTALQRTSTLPTVRDNDAENVGPTNRHRRGQSVSNSLYPTSTNGSRARAGSVSSSRHRGIKNMDRQPSFMSPGMRKRTTSWNLNGPSALGGHGPVRRRGTLRLGGSASSAVDIGGDTVSAAGFTLAGPGNPIESIIANQAYVDPGYTDLNPAYEMAANSRPVWGLAKPLPHVVRPGMIPTTSEIREQAPGQLRHEQEAEENFDLEAGRVESTINPNKISAALQAAQQDREFRLLRTYTGQSQIGGSARRRSSVSSAAKPAPRRPSVPEQVGKVDQQPEAKERRQHRVNVTELASVLELKTPDEHDNSDDQGYFPPQLVSQPEETEKLDGDWIEETEQLEPYDAELDEIHNLHTHWSVIRLKFREPLAELLAITCQLTIGFCADLALILNKSTGDTSNWAWGLASMIGIYIAGGVSGAHLNPAMSIMLWIYRGFPLRKIPAYAIAQLLGAFIAALISFGLFRTSIIACSGTTVLANTDTASAFLIYPRHSWVDPVTAFFTEFAGTAILAVVVLALGDDSNAPPGAGMNAFVMALVVTVLSMAFSYNTGLAMNPARDMGPRLALFALGYGADIAFNGSPSYWFLGSWCGPILGALFGALLYDGAIFVGGESPVNYPRRRIKRALHKKKNKWNRRFQAVTKGLQFRRPKYASDEWRFEVEEVN